MEEITDCKKVKDLNFPSVLSLTAFFCHLHKAMELDLCTFSYFEHFFHPPAEYFTVLYETEVTILDYFRRLKIKSAIL